jgi:hypothetical protein
MPIPIQQIAIKQVDKLKPFLLLCFAFILSRSRARRLISVIRGSSFGSTGSGDFTSL